MIRSTSTQSCPRPANAFITTKSSAEQVRKAKYDLDESQIKPYFELDNVLKNGVFYAANQLYGLTFKERKDIPVYQPDVHVYEVFDQDGKSLALFYTDYFKRDNKGGGAWMDNFVGQSKLMHTKPVIYNVANFTKPAAGQPLDTLVSLQEMPFQSVEPLPGALVAAAGETRLQTWFELASRWAGVGGAAIVLLVFLRLFARQKPEPVPVEVLSLPQDAQARALNSPNSVTPELLNELIRQKPANVGVALRDWVAAGTATTASKN